MLASNAARRAVDRWNLIFCFSCAVKGDAM
jgi:hypothetical protein